MAAGEIEQQLAALRPSLLAIARLQLRNDAWAEDAVSETLVAALEGAPRFTAQSQVKTWVVGILKHKIIDHFRRARREVSTDAAVEAAEVETFRRTLRGGRASRLMPLNGATRSAAFERTQFFDVLQACVDQLPASLGAHLHDARMARLRHQRRSVRNSASPRRTAS